MLWGFGWYWVCVGVWGLWVGFGVWVYGVCVCVCVCVCVYGVCVREGVCVAGGVGGWGVLCVRCGAAARIAFRGCLLYGVLVLEPSACVTVCPFPEDLRSLTSTVRFSVT